MEFTAVLSTDQTKKVKVTNCVFEGKYVRE